MIGNPLIMTSPSTSAITLFISDLVTLKYDNSLDHHGNNWLWTSTSIIQHFGGKITNLHFLNYHFCQALMRKLLIENQKSIKIWSCSFQQNHEINSNLGTIFRSTSRVGKGHQRIWWSIVSLHNTVALFQILIENVSV